MKRHDNFFLKQSQKATQFIMQPTIKTFNCSIKKLQKTRVKELIRELLQDMNKKTKQNNNLLHLAKYASEQVKAMHICLCMSIYMLFDSERYK